MSSELKVTSHVGRDLLSSAAAFKNEAIAVWEYVVNSLQYTERGLAPRIGVRVSPKNKSITISDNGLGMDRKDLKHFFTMHGENRERLTGRIGRGKFGTGKSAAFGIANTLIVDTVKNDQRNVVRLTRSMIKASDGQDVPTEWLVEDETTEDPNGTVIRIEDCNLMRIRTALIAEYIERHLQAFRALAPEVAVNSHLCAYREPELEGEYSFHPTAKQVEVLGEVELFIKVARAPLPEAERGIAITAGAGNLIAVEACGIDTKEHGSYLFGEIDVTALETTDTPFEPYDSHRTLQLNPEHPVVGVLLGFLGSKLEAVRRKLQEKAREARQDEEARRLALEADKLAEVLNEDFHKVRRRLQEIRSAAARAGSAATSFGSGQEAGDEPDLWVEGIQEPGTVERSRKEPQAEGAGSGRPAPDISVRGEQAEDGQDTVDPAGGKERKKRRPRGGFSVEYRNLGKNEERSHYDSSSLTILINLGHPVLAAALRDGRVEDPTFRRLSFEIAFSEYAMGLGYELFKHDPSVPADDLLYEVRSTLNRVALSAAPLYRL